MRHCIDVFLDYISFSVVTSFTDVRPRNFRLALKFFNDTLKEDPRNILAWTEPLWCQKQRSQNLSVSSRFRATYFWLELYLFGLQLSLICVWFKLDKVWFKCHIGSFCTYFAITIISMNIKTSIGSCILLWIFWMRHKLRPNEKLFLELYLFTSYNILSLYVQFGKLGSGNFCIKCLI